MKKVIIATFICLLGLTQARAAHAAGGWVVAGVFAGAAGLFKVIDYVTGANTPNVTQYACPTGTFPYKIKDDNGNDVIICTQNNTNNKQVYYNQNPVIHTNNYKVQQATTKPILLGHGNRPIQKVISRQKIEMPVVQTQTPQQINSNGALAANENLTRLIAQQQIEIERLKSQLQNK